MSDMAKMMLNVIRKFSENKQTAELALIQIVIFDSSMCEGFACALQSAAKDSQSLLGRAKRKSAEFRGASFSCIINEHNKIVLS